MITPVTKRIVSKTTTVAFASSCVVFLIAVTVVNAGTAWTMVIQDKASTPNILIPSFTLALPTDSKVNLLLNLEQDFPLPMDGGIDIITGGTTAGEVVVRMILGTGD